MKWYADSGATQHQTDQQSSLTNFIAVEPGTWMVSGIGETCLSVHGQGDVQVEARVNGSFRSVTFEKVLYVPGLVINLFSIGAATELGAKAVFVNNSVKITQNNILIMEGHRAGRTLYLLDILLKTKTQDVISNLAKQKFSLLLWHQRLGHVNYETIQKMAEKESVDGLNLEKYSEIPKEPCTGCIYGKMKRTSFKTGRTRGAKIGDIVHSDICGPMQTASTGGARFFALFKDDFTGFNVVYFLKQKSQIDGYLQAYVARVERETGNFIHTLRTDNGGEYVGRHLADWLMKKGIRHERTVPYTPQQNGVAERANRTVMEAVRSLLHSKNLPLELWAEAVNWSIHILNRVLSSTTSKTPFEGWYEKKPNISDFLVFGSKVITTSQINTTLF